MKKFLSLFLVSLCLLFVTGCNKTHSNQNGVWISYYELEKMFQSDLKKEFQTVIENCKQLQIENLYIHTRAFGSTIYKSDYFPLLKSVKKYDFDVLEYFINQCKKHGLKVQAWVNPYRILSGSEDITKLDAESPAYRWLNDDIKQNDSNVAFSDGIYLNPASSEVRCLIIDSLRELIVRYDIDGIHFDDYFYPTTKTDFDETSYSQYKSNTLKAKNLFDWRRSNVNELIEQCYKAIKYSNHDIVFSISPAASIEQNYNNLYADVGKWVDEGFVDEIIPQLYFGFEYPDDDFKFLNLLQKWKDLANRNKKVKLKIGLGVYKAKPKLEPDIKEWSQNSDIISRQTEICQKDKNVSGFVLFSYSTLFSNDKEFKQERENLKKILGE